MNEANAVKRQRRAHAIRQLMQLFSTARDEPLAPADAHRILSDLLTARDGAGEVPGRTAPISPIQSTPPLPSTLVERLAGASMPHPTEPGPLLGDDDWAFFRLFLVPRGPCRGRKQRAPRLALEGMLWIAASGQAWRDLPAAYGKWNSVYRQFRRWHRNGAFEMIEAALDHRPDAAARIRATLARLRELTQRPTRR